MANSFSLFFGANGNSADSSTSSGIDGGASGGIINGTSDGGGIGDGGSGWIPCKYTS